MEIDERAPFLLLQNETTELCQPLFENSQINYFEMHQYTDEGQFIALTNKPILDLIYLKEGIYATKQELLASTCDSDLNVVILSKDFYHAIAYLENKAICNINLASQQGIFHRIYIAKRKATHFNLFGFGSDIDDVKIVTTMLSNLDVLIQFTQYFEENAQSLIQQSHKRSICLPHFNHTLSQEYNNHDPLINRKELLEHLSKSKKKNLITKREYECLTLSTQGYTAKEIAKALDISYRTVERHIENIKIKTGSVKKSCLWKILHDFETSCFN